MVRTDYTLASVHQKKASGAVSVLSLTGVETSLPHERRLLIAQDSGDCHIFHSAQGGDRVDFTAGADARQYGFGNSEFVQEFFVP